MSDLPRTDGVPPGPPWPDGPLGPDPADPMTTPGRQAAIEAALEDAREAAYPMHGGIHPSDRASVESKRVVFTRGYLAALDEQALAEQPRGEEERLRKALRAARDTAHLGHREVVCHSDGPDPDPATVLARIMDVAEAALNAEHPRGALSAQLALFRAVQQATQHMTQAEITERVATILRDA